MLAEGARAAWPRGSPGGAVCCALLRPSAAVVFCGCFNGANALFCAVEVGRLLLVAAALLIFAHLHNKSCCWLAGGAVCFSRFFFAEKAHARAVACSEAAAFAFRVCRCGRSSSGAFSTVGVRLFAPHPRGFPTRSFFFLFFGKGYKSSSSCVLVAAAATSPALLGVPGVFSCSSRNTQLAWRSLYAALCVGRRAGFFAPHQRRLDARTVDV